MEPRSDSSQKKTRTHTLTRTRQSPWSEANTLGLVGSQCVRISEQLATPYAARPPIPPAAASGGGVRGGARNRQEKQRDLSSEMFNRRQDFSEREKQIDYMN